jgi:hypothetical protein
MKHINDDNIDEIMFQLLEGDITGIEREQLLEAIEADEAYKKLWATWQQTIIRPEAEMLVMNTGKLKKKSVRVIPWHYKYAVAAMLLIGFGLAVFFYNSGSTGPAVVDVVRPVRTKQPVRQVPQPEITKEDNNKEDSSKIVPLKEKIRMIAGKGTEKTVVKPEEPKPYMIRQEKPEIVHAPLENIAVKEDKKTPVEQVPVIPVLTPEEDHIVVTMTTDSQPTGSIREKSRDNLLTRLFSRPRFKIENDSSTRTNKRLIIENKQYKIIAGF